MRKLAKLSLSGLLLAILAIWLGPELLRGIVTAGRDATTSTSSSTSDAPAHSASAHPTSAQATPTFAHVDTSVGFTSQSALEEHFQKHGREFGSITQGQYLRLAQELRGADVGGDVREAARADGVITRFDVRTGAFLAFHEDKSIRTFFKPNDGLRYFERQLDKEH